MGSSLMHLPYPNSSHVKSAAAESLREHYLRPLFEAGPYLSPCLFPSQPMKESFLDINLGRHAFPEVP
jgi:hypothetical protein